MFILRPQTSHHHYACRAGRTFACASAVSLVVGWENGAYRGHHPGENTTAVGFPSTGLWLGDRSYQKEWISD